MQLKARNSKGEIVDIRNFHSWEEAHSDTYTDQYGYGFPVTPHMRSDKKNSFCFINASEGGISHGMSPEHYFAERIIAKILADPKRRFNVVYWSPRKKEIDLKEYYDTVSVEKKQNGRIPDILLSDSQNRYPPIFIEIWKTSRCEPEKISEGHLIIQLRIVEKEDIFDFLHDWGIKESFLKEHQPKVRFYNFRERSTELPWNVI